MLAAMFYISYRLIALSAILLIGLVWSVIRNRS
jgi:hypothetical protein